MMRCNKGILAAFVWLGKLFFQPCGPHLNIRQAVAFPIGKEFDLAQYGAEASPGRRPYLSYFL